MFYDRELRRANKEIQENQNMGEESAVSQNPRIMSFAFEG